MRQLDLFLYIFCWCDLNAPVQRWFHLLWWKFWMRRWGGAWWGGIWRGGCWPPGRRAGTGPPWTGGGCRSCNDGWSWSSGNWEPFFSNQVKSGPSCHDTFGFSPEPKYTIYSSKEKLIDQKMWRWSAAVQLCIFEWIPFIGLAILPAPKHAMIKLIFC